MADLINTDMKDGRWITIDDAAPFLNLSRQGVTNLINQGRLAICSKNYYKTKTLVLVDDIERLANIMRISNKNVGTQIRNTAEKVSVNKRINLLSKYV